MHAASNNDHCDDVDSSFPLYSQAPQAGTGSVTEKENDMAAPNAQPCGDRPGPAAVHEHAPVQGPMPPGGFDTSDIYDNGAAVAEHGTPAPVGNGKKNPLK